MKRCTRCIKPETETDITFDENRVCSECKNIEIKNKVNWTEREAMLRKLLDHYRGKTKPYDCIVPMSGGKDSSFQLYMVKKVYKMNPLAVTFNHMFFIETRKQNLENTLRTLGVDHVMFSPNIRVFKKLIPKSLEGYGDVCWHCHNGIGSFPLRVAIQYETPLMIWGEPQSEAGILDTYNEIHIADARFFEVYLKKGIGNEHMLGDGITMYDLAPYQYPPFKQLERIRFKGIFLGDYIPSNVTKQVELIKREISWQEADVENSPSRSYNVECKIGGIHDYLKYIKRGHGRTVDIFSKAIREGRMKREDALRLWAKYDANRPKSLDWFLPWVGISENEFIDTAKKRCVPPWKYEEKRNDS
jgi:N-acetyl sugar amidotransferase